MPCVGKSEIRDGRAAGRFALFWSQAFGFLGGGFFVVFLMGEFLFLCVGSWPEMTGTIHFVSLPRDTQESSGKSDPSVHVSTATIHPCLYEQSSTRHAIRRCRCTRATSWNMQSIGMSPLLVFDFFSNVRRQISWLLVLYIFSDGPTGAFRAHHCFAHGRCNL